MGNAQMPAIGRLLWGLDPERLLPCLPFSPTFLHSCPTYSSSQLTQGPARCCSWRLRLAQNQFHRVPNPSSSGGWGCDSVAWGRMGEGPSERGADKACNLPVSLSVSHRSPQPLLPSQLNPTISLGHLAKPGCQPRLTHDHTCTGTHMSMMLPDSC